MKRMIDELNRIRPLRWGEMNPTGRKLEAAKQTKKDEKFEKEVEEEVMNYFKNKRGLN